MAAPNVRSSKLLKHKDLRTNAHRARFERGGWVWVLLRKLASLLIDLAS
jgi:hypothetical protein